MNRMTATILSLALAASAAWAGDAPTDEKPKTPAEQLYEKLLAENTKDADKKYGEYLKALEAANQKILAGLEAVKADLKDTTRHTCEQVANRV